MPRRCFRQVGATRKVRSFAQEHWLEAEASETSRRGQHGPGIRASEEKTRFQVCGLEEASNKGPQGCQPFHQRAMRLQGQARFQDGARFGDEEVEGVNQLIHLS